MPHPEVKASNDDAIRQATMRDLYSAGTGSLIVEGQPAPFQSVPSVLMLLGSDYLYFPEVPSITTGACIVITKNQIDQPEDLAAMVPDLEAALSPVARSPASVLDRVRAIFGLNISETAEVFCITRQTVYQWMKLDDMEQVRSHENRNRIKQLYAAAQLWQDYPPLKGHWLHALLPHGNTVFDLLKDLQLDLNALRAARNVLAAGAAARRHEEGERATQAATALAEALAGLGAGRKARRG